MYKSFIAVLILLLMLLPNNVLASTNESMSGVVVFDGQPIANAEIEIWYSGLDEPIKTKSGTDGLWSIQFDPTILEIGDQVRIKVTFTDNNGNDRVMTTCRIRDSAIGLFFSLFADDESIQIGQAGWENYGDEGDDYNPWYYHFEQNSRYTYEEKFYTVNSQFTDLYVNIGWEDELIIDCNLQTEVSIIVDFNLHDMTNNEVLSPNDWTEDYIRTDYCEDSSDGEKYTSDPIIYITIELAPGESKRLIPKGTITLNYFLNEWQKNDFEEWSWVNIESGQMTMDDPPNWDDCLAEVGNIGVCSDGITITRSF